MKIAIDCRYFGKSGIGTFIENVLDELLKNHPEHEYLLIKDKDTQIKAYSSRVSFLLTNIKPFSIKELFFFPIKEINNCDSFFTPYISIPGGIKIPTYSTIHDMVFFDVEGLTSPLGKFIRRIYYKRAIALSNSLFTVSEFSKSRIFYHFPTNKDITIVYNGLSRAIQDYKRDYDPEKKDYFIFVGNIKRHKGLHILVEAYGKARKYGLKSKLIIVGSNDKLRTADSNLARTIKEMDGIEFTGWVNNEKLIRLISEAKALVQPSFYEGFGIPPLEALCLGTDIIISNIPVFKELYSEIPNCFFCVGDSKDLANKLMNFVQNPKLVDFKNLLLMKYNYQKSADIIIETIERDVQKIS